MAITIDYLTKIISVPQSFLTALGGSKYELDANAFRIALNDLEDSEDGVSFPQTLRHSTEATLSGVTYARQLEIINGYTVAFENTGIPYTVKVTGANHNLGDVTNFDGGMSMIIGNSAGLMTVNTGGTVAPSAQEIRDAMTLAALDTPVAGSIDANIAAVPAAVGSRVVEGTYTADEMLKIMSSILAGKVSGAGTGIETFRDLLDTIDRVTVNTDETGNRTSVVRNVA